MSTDKDARRFWSKVEICVFPGECWLWMANRHKKGYGKFWYKRMTVLAHRMAWQFINGPVPNGMVVMHNCDNPRCVNPSHLSAGTHSDNGRDMVSRGRNKDRRGEKNGRSKLTEADVRDIRRRCASGETQLSAGSRYGVNYATVSDITRGTTWKHLK